MKYILLLGSEVTNEYDDKAEALQSYHEYVADEGDYFDLTLCEVIETHEAPEQEYKEVSAHLHYDIDFSSTKQALEHYQRYVDSLENERTMLQKIKHLLFGR